MTPGTFVVLRLLLAWLVGAAVLFYAVVITAYDSISAFMSQPVFAPYLGDAFLLSAFHVAACVVAGLSLLWLRRFRAFRLWWSLAAKGLGLLGASLLIYSASFGRHSTDMGFAQGPVVELGRTALPGYVVLLFAIANFPAPLIRVPPAFDRA